MYHVLCIMYYVLCIMYYVLCIMYYVLCIMYYVLCIMYYVLCIMYYVLCIMYYVLCNMYYVICIIQYVLCITSALRLLGRFTTYLAQTTTAKRLLIASTRHSVPRGCEKNWKFSIFNFFKFCNIMMTFNSTMSKHI